MSKNIGSLEVITGSMFSGKSEELIRRIRRARYAKQKLLVFSPSIDNRYGEDGIYSHNKNNFEAYSISKIEEMNKILEEFPDVEVIGIDEIQFFDPKVVDFCIKCVELGKRVIVAGLDLDFRAIPFNPLPHLMAIADKVNKLSAICTVCGNTAYASQRLINGLPAYEDDPLVAIGSVEQYEARCRLHHIVRKRNENYDNIEVFININKVNLKERLSAFELETFNVINLEHLKNVKDLRNYISNNKDKKLVIDIQKSISTIIEGNYKLIDFLFEIIKISKFNILISKKESEEELLTTFDLLNRSKITVNKIYVLNNEVYNLSKIKANTGIEVINI